MKTPIAFLLGIGCMFAIAATQKQTLEERVKKLEKFQLDQIFETFQARRAYLDVGQQGFSLLQNEYGTFAFRLEDVVAYAAGSKVSVKAMNLTSGSYSSCEWEITWFRKNGSPISTHLKDTTELYPGRWVDVEFINANVPLSNLSKITIEVSPKVIGPGR